MLAKVRVGSGEGPVVLRRNGVPNADAPLVPEGRLDHVGDQRRVHRGVAGWRRERVLTESSGSFTAGRRMAGVLGIRETDDLRLSVVGLDVHRARRESARDLGPSPPVNNPLRGFGCGR